MADQLKGLTPETPDVVLDKSAPWYVKLLPWLGTWVRANPGLASVIMLLGVLYWVFDKYAARLETGQLKVVTEMRAAITDLDGHREKREDVVLKMMTNSIDRVAMGQEKVIAALERNTDAVRGKVFTPKSTNPPKNDGAKKGPDG